MVTHYRFRLTKDEHSLGVVPVQDEDEQRACDQARQRFDQRARSKGVDLDWEALRLRAEAYSPNGDRIRPYDFDGISVKSGEEIKWGVQHRLRAGARASR